MLGVLYPICRFIICIRWFAVFLASHCITSVPGRRPPLSSRAGRASPQLSVYCTPQEAVHPKRLPQCFRNPALLQQCLTQEATPRGCSPQEAARARASESKPPRTVNLRAQEAAQVLQKPRTSGAVESPCLTPRKLQRCCSDGPRGEAARPRPGGGRRADPGGVRNC